MIVIFVWILLLCVFVLRRGNEEKKMNSFSSKEKLYITNLIWPPYNFSPSSATASHPVKPPPIM